MGEHTPSARLRQRLLRRACAGLLIFLLASAARPAYSVLAHEAIIDSAWHDAIRPLLLKRCLNATPEQLKEARGYAYGGAVIQDMGYYPFGSKFFGDATHYIRSGDFVQALLRDEAETGHATLVNDNFDTGTVTGPGQYPLADKTYAEIMDRPATNDSAGVTPELQKALLDFYRDPNAPFTTKRNGKEWEKVSREVNELRAIDPELDPAKAASTP